MYELEQKGVVSHENWLAFIENKSCLGTYEFPLYTDAKMKGELASGLEPYSILNQITALDAEQNIATPALVLRVDMHYKDVEHKADQMLSETHDKRYHGGWIADEIAALFSLLLGIRLQAGECSRIFLPGIDSKGRPQAHGLYRAPQLPRKRQSNAVLPYTSGWCNLEDAKFAKTLPKLKRNTAITLIKAARLYQDGIWIADSQPELAWLLLTSAIETAAVGHKSKDPPIEKLKKGNPTLYAFLEKYNEPELIEGVALEISDHFKSTSKFINFVLDLLPEPRKSRPECYEFNWSKNNFKKALSRIYSCRSNALHNGIPFPMPMCMPPMRNTEIYFEIPPGLAAAASGGNWIAEDTPMYLHLFEYIVRKTLLKWWESQVPKA